MSDIFGGFLLSGEDYQCAMSAVAVLSARGIRVLSVNFSPYNVDVHVADGDATRALPNAARYARFNGRDVWQASLWGVRVIWEDRLAPEPLPMRSIADKPRPAPAPVAVSASLWQRFSRWLYGDGIHAD